MVGVRIIEIDDIDNGPEINKCQNRCFSLKPLLVFVVPWWTSHAHARRK